MIIHNIILPGFLSAQKPEDMIKLGLAVSMGVPSAMNAAWAMQSDMVGNACKDGLQLK